jgi:O-antigen/teichoic acid export membrane protein
MLSAVTIGSGLFSLLLLVILTKLYGLSGAAMAFAAGMLVRFLLTWWVAQRRHAMPWFTATSDKLTQPIVDAQ